MTGSDDIEFLTVERLLSALKGNAEDKKFAIAILSSRDVGEGTIKIERPGGLCTPAKWEGHYTVFVWRIAE